MAKAKYAGFGHDAWLTIAQGGWWKPGDIVAKTGSEIPSKAASTILWIMAERYGMLIARGAYDTKEYAVCKRCTIPRSITAGELATVFRRSFPTEKELRKQ
jgi:hypothetical protein